MKAKPKRNYYLVAQRSALYYHYRKNDLIIQVYFRLTYVTLLFSIG